MWRTRGLCTLLLWLGCFHGVLASAQSAVPPPVEQLAAEPPPQERTDREGASYTFTEPSDRSGTGKWILGREIAHFMSHLGSSWLERPEREREERTDDLVEALGIEPGDVVADFGTGSGYFATRMARKVGDTGRVLAVDIQPEMLRLVRSAVREQALTNVETVLASEDDATLPDGLLDLILLVDVYHELAFPLETVEQLAQALRPGGRLVLVEYRAEDPTVPIKRLHKMTEQQVKAELALNPVLRWVETDDRLPRQHIMIFERFVLEEAHE